MTVWEFACDKLEKDIACILLHVVQSEGSSPGRQGFKMVVAEDGSFMGTIGGGIMEYKLVEKARALLQQQQKTILLLPQYHNKEEGINQSGMICSGKQLIAFISLDATDAKMITAICVAEKSNEKIAIKLSPSGIALHSVSGQYFYFNADEDWLYIEPINQQPVIHIIGGGHVSLALSQLMHQLGFYIKLYDDRKNLNTIETNSFADEKMQVDYAAIESNIEIAPQDFAVIMTIGYRTDKIVVKQLLGKSFFYLGMLGSKNKADILFAELKAEGIAPAALKKIHTPIGLPISSKTAMEIAVSIAAEIIREKNSVSSK